MVSGYFGYFVGSSCAAGEFGAFWVFWGDLGCLDFWVLGDLLRVDACIELLLGLLFV